MQIKHTLRFLLMMFLSITILSCKEDESDIPYSFNGIKIGYSSDSVSHIFESPQALQKGIFRYDIDTLLHYEVAILRTFDGEKILAKTDRNVMKESFSGPLSIRFKNKKVDQISAEASPVSIDGFRLIANKYENLYGVPKKKSDSTYTWTKGKYSLDLDLRKSHLGTPVLYLLIWKNPWLK